MGSGVVCAIPARWASVRLPGKPLRDLCGRPLIEHVVERVRRARGIDRTVVLTDDERIARAVEGFGGEVEMTPENCASGTDRIAFAAREWTAKVVINVQGDEPLIHPGEIERLARYLTEDSSDEMATFAARVDEAELDDPNRVKVVLDRNGRALYFSRAPIPWPRNRAEVPLTVWRHIGIYGYRRETLLRLAELEPTPLECMEGLEQLRALENGIAIGVLESHAAPIGVDTEEDLHRVEALLQNEAENEAESEARVASKSQAGP